MATVTLTYNPLLRPPKFPDQYRPELELRMSPPVFATRMRALNAAARQSHALSRAAQLRTVAFLSLVIIAVVLVEAAVLEAKTQSSVPAPWFLAFLASALAALAGVFLLFGVQYQRRQGLIHKEISGLIEEFNSTDNLVGIEWTLKQAKECRGTWLHPNIPWRVVIQVTDGEEMEVVEVPRADVELEATDLPPPPYSLPTAAASS